jgi:diguanylate cyclase (GGDEF)-like protein
MERQCLIRSLFNTYIEMYAARDDRLTTLFSENFTGYTGGSSALVADRDEWIRITRQDFAEVPEHIGIEMLDIATQDLCDDVVMVTAFFHIHLPIPDHILSHRTARLVLVFRNESGDWKIAHSGISIPYHLVKEGEVYPLKGLNERNQELEALVMDRTRELAEANSKLEALSYTDGLTGIANRRSFDRMLTQEWKRGQRASKPLSLIMLDVDHFKHFNDLYGHQAGDACLRMLACTLAQAGRRAGELAARYGGEEFVMLLPETDGPAAMEIAHSVQQDVWSLALPHPETAPAIITVSLGVASLVPSILHRPEDLLQRADAALYQAKQSGRNCVQYGGD